MANYTPVTPCNFGGLPEENSSYKTSKAVVFPIPLERTTSYETGTRRGPDAILAASRNMETYDEELGLEIYRKIGIATLPAIDTNEGELQHVMDEIEAAELALLEDDKFPIALGGEHSLTAPLVRAAAKKFKKLTVLQIDAHADLRESFHGTPLSHASVMRRVVEVCPAVQVGIRSLSAEEAEAIPSLNTKIYWGKDIAHLPPEKWVSKVTGDLSPNVYLTIDLDGFDPAYVPATGTPEPGGLNWRQVTTLIREVATKKRIVAMDVVELLPQSGEHASDFLAAKLIYKTLGYIFSRKG
ncbi:MAG: agmatinase [Acidobacteria bacterium]|nr:agmatinase [Acidobacteriota bacterium]